MRIGILQTGDASDEMKSELGDLPGLFETLLDERGFEFQTWRVLDMEFPDGPFDADGWLITGSKFGAYEDHPFIPPLEQLIREIHTARVPLVGICFGHQIIAQALGGRVEKFSGGWAVGRQTYDFGGTPVSLNAWHQDQVVELPPGAKVEASSPFCDYAGLSYGDKIFTIQPHPEFTARAIDILIRTRGKAVPDILLQDAQAQLDRPLDESVLADQLAKVLKS